MYTINQKQHSGLANRLVTACLLLAMSVFNSVAYAEEAGNTTTAYVDSVHSWGTWALGIEPAAGPQAAQNMPMNDRSANLKFRPSDNAAYQTVAIPEPQVSTPPIPTPPAPIGPPGLVPTTGPVPVGGPFFPCS